MKKIWIIEDDVVLRKELIKLLIAYGYDCESSDDFEHVIENSLNAKADLILLDINLPFYDGYYVCREIRKQSSVPIIVVTSRNNDMDELMSMNLGADDFITKPYNTQILLARIGAILKRLEQNSANDRFEHKGVSLISSKSIIVFNNSETELTKNEMKFFLVLIQKKGAIVSRDDLMNELWQSDEFVDDNTLTVNVNRLRKKLEEIGVKDYIVTKRGQGYIV